jgi:hypothetical protein
VWCLTFYQDGYVVANVYKHAHPDEMDDLCFTDPTSIQTGPLAGSTNSDLYELVDEHFKQGNIYYAVGN